MHLTSIFVANIKGGVSDFWKPMLTFEITKTNTPLLQKGLAPILIAPPHTYVRQRLVLWSKAKPMLLTYREETKQPRHPITGLPAPWVLSSAGKLIWYLHGSYFLPYRKPSFVPQTFSSFVFYPVSLSFCRRSAQLMSVMCTDERSLLCIMSRHAPYCWLATSLFWYSAPTQFSKAFLKKYIPHL